LLTIGTVASQLGVSPDVLRKWEIRHGWPAPVRTKGGTRLYDQQLMLQLRTARRMIESGHAVAEALSLARDAAPDLHEVSRIAAPIEALLHLVATGQVSRLRAELLAMRSAHDDIEFVETCAAPFMRAVGQSWACGRIRIWNEHAASAVMREVLDFPVVGEVTQARHDMPLALLTTPPGERHTLGVSMAKLMLSRFGVTCISLGAETPHDELVSAAQAYGAGCVGLSVCRGYSSRALHAYVEALRNALPPTCELWLGGSGASRRSAKLQQSIICCDAASVAQNVRRRWPGLRRGVSAGDAT